MKYVGGWCKDIVLIANTDSLNVTAYKLSSLIKFQENIENTVGLTKDGVSEEDFLEDITAKSLVYDGMDLMFYLLGIMDFGAINNKQSTLMFYYDSISSDPSYVEVMLERSYRSAHNYTTEALDYWSLLHNFTDGASYIRILDMGEILKEDKNPILMNMSFPRCQVVER